MIEKYEFGRIRIDGKEYSRDVIIYPSAEPADSAGGQPFGSAQDKPARVDGSWWRKEGHRLDKADLAQVVKAKPEVLVVGTGHDAQMKVPRETLEFLNSLGIEVHTAPTREACQKYNELRDVRKVVAALHLTC
jgi:hypothetical protein